MVVLLYTRAAFFREKIRICFKTLSLFHHFLAKNRKKERMTIYHMYRHSSERHFFSKKGQREDGWEGYALEFAFYKNFLVVVDKVWKQL